MARCPERVRAFDDGLLSNHRGLTSSLHPPPPHTPSSTSSPFSTSLLLLLLSLVFFLLVFLLLSFFPFLSLLQSPSPSSGSSCPFSSSLPSSPCMTFPLLANTSLWYWNFKLLLITLRVYAGMHRSFSSSLCLSLSLPPSSLSLPLSLRPSLSHTHTLMCSSTGTFNNRGRHMYLPHIKPHIWQ